MTWTVHLISWIFNHGKFPSHIKKSVSPMISPEGSQQNKTLFLSFVRVR